MDRSMEFEALQSRLLALWPAIGAPTEEEKTMVVVPSVSMDVPPELGPALPAYEERYLFLLLLLRQPKARVIYVTSSPVLPRIIDYYLGLVEGLDTPESRVRLATVSVGDPSLTPLSKKLLDRPRTLARIRDLIGDPKLAHLVPFVTSELEEELALELGIPMYASPARTLHLGTKTGSRRIFLDEDIPHPRGRDGLTNRRNLENALKELRAEGVSQCVAKLDRGIGGLGNALIELGDDVGASIDEMRFEGEGDVASFMVSLAEQGAIVEERIVGDELRSPSVQLRVAPDGDVELLSTHDQVLGGPGGQSYLGARFPADPEYASAITELAAGVGRKLAHEGVLGRLAVDFVVVRRELEWEPFAIEINLRKGGTTHPFLTLQLLTNGIYDPETARFKTSTGEKHYVATDHLDHEAHRLLTPDDLLDMAADKDFGWDPKREVGVVFHMISALPAIGRIGFTAIGDSPKEADELYERVAARLADEVS